MGTETSSEKDIDIELTKLRVEYWTTRSNQTLSHTDSSSRLIYVIDGAVLALVYFAINTLGPSRSVILLMSFPVFMLAVINYLHSEFIRIQHHWTNNIDKRLLELLDEPEVRSPAKSFRVSSSHGVYRSIHIVIAVSLLIIAIFMVFYGLGNFPNIV